jgi:hypothetical protein
MGMVRYSKPRADQRVTIELINRRDAEGAETKMDHGRIDHPLQLQGCRPESQT